MLIATDPLSLVFIACFLFGLLFLLVTTLLGSLGHGHIGHAGSHAVATHGGLHVGGHASLPHAGGMHVGSHAPQVGSHGTTPTVGQGVQPHQAGSQNAQGSDFSIFTFINPTSIVLFLLGFGFFGYVFHNTTHLVLPLTLVLASVGGLLIAAIILVFLSRLLSDSGTDIANDVSDRTGMLGKVSLTIPANGLGEIIYVSPGGMRKSIPARSTDGRRLERGQEVVVVNYQHGVAEIDTWERFMNEEDAVQTNASASHEDELAKLRALLEQSDAANTELVIRKDLQKE